MCTKGPGTNLELTAVDAVHCDVYIAFQGFGRHEDINARSNRCGRRRERVMKPVGSSIGGEDFSVPCVDLDEVVRQFDDDDFEQ